MHYPREAVDLEKHREGHGSIQYGLELAIGNVGIMYLSMCSGLKANITLLVMFTIYI